jgi:hypothetical protein
MDPSALKDLDEAYAKWQEEESRHAHLTSVWNIMDTLDPESHPQDAAEMKYQQLRSRYSPAYFSGSIYYKGERLFQQHARQEEDDRCDVVTLQQHQSRTAPLATRCTVSLKEHVDDMEWGKLFALWVVFYGVQSCNNMSGFE